MDQLQGDHVGPQANSGSDGSGTKQAGTSTHGNPTTPEGCDSRKEGAGYGK